MKMRVCVWILVVFCAGLLPMACMPPQPSVPTAAFNATPITGTAPLMVQFTDASTVTGGGVPSSWAWNFGDGGTSTAQSPLHTYNNPGVYTVALTATAPDGSNTLTRDAFITVTDPLAPPAAPKILVAPSTPVNTNTAAITGTAEPNAIVRVIGSADTGLSVTASATGAFAVTVTLNPNTLNRIFLIARNAAGVESAPAPVAILQDRQDPAINIDFPANGAELTNETIQVAGRISDTLSGFMGLDAIVNGLAASVYSGIGTNGSFERRDVPLALGENTITVTATDFSGNRTTDTITVTRVAVSGPHMEIVSGNDQVETVNGELDLPIVVQVNDANGAPFPNKAVTFHVVRSNGRLDSATGGEAGAMLFQTRTDAQGRAQAFWTLGSDAGQGNNRVEVTSEDIAGTTFFCASAETGPPVQINIGTGNNQRVEAGGPAPEVLNAWVSDGGNGVEGVPVIFRVVAGDGSLGSDGATQVTVTTDGTGHAKTAFASGVSGGNNIVEADFAGNAGIPASFSIFGVERVEGQPTTFSGLVLDNASSPIGGVEVSMHINGENVAPVLTNAAGEFTFTGIPSGHAHGHFEGSVATTLNGEPIAAGSFPSLPFETIIVANAANTLSRAALLPQLDPANRVIYDGTEDVELTVAGVEGLRMIVKAGSMTRVDGSVPGTADPATLSLNQVHYDDVPMPMPDGVAPTFAWTLQPSGAHFDPPIEVIYPNMSGLPAGAAAYFLSFEHATNTFEIVSSARVSDDASEIVSDPGAGIPVAGWGGNCPPYAVTGKLRNCFEVAVAFLDGNPRCPQAFPGLCPEAWADTAFSSAFDDLADVVRELAPMRVTAKVFPAANSAAAQIFAVNQWMDRLTEEPRPEVPDSDECPRPFLILVGHSLGGDTVRLADSLDADISIIADGISRELTLDAFPGAAFYQRDQVLAGVGGIINFITPDALTAEERMACSDVGFENFADIECLRGFRVQGDTAIEVPGADHRTIIESAPFQERVISEIVTALDLPTPPKQGEGENLLLDSRFTMYANGQAYQLENDGLIEIPNVTAPDQFGPGGPGTRPDFFADELISVSGVANIDGQLMYATSAMFRVLNGGVTSVNEFTLSDTPPPFPKRLLLDTASAVLAPGATSQLTTTAVQFDDTENDVTPVASGTAYRVSSTDFITVDDDGVLSAVQNGVAVVTASNQGATSVRRVTIASDTIMTTVEGFLFDEDGNPIAGATVTTTAFGGNGTTDANGFFSFELTLPSTTQFVTILASNDAIQVDSGLIPVVPGGISDAGILAPMSTRFMTTVSGTVQREDESPVQNAAVFTSLGGQGLSNASGAFSFVLEGRVPDGGLPPITVTARLTVGESTLSGQVTGIAVVPDGATNAGAITISETIELLYPGARFSVGDGPRAAQTADLNGDGLLDLAITTNANLNGVTTSRLATVLNRGNGAFGPPQSVSIAANPDDLVLDDMNGDDVLDAIVPGFLTNVVQVLLGDGTGAFGPPSVYTPNVMGVSRVASGDINGDNNSDVILTSTFPVTVFTYLGKGDGTLEEPTSFTAEGNNIIEPELSDLNGDENLDLLLINRGLSRLEVYLGNGDATFDAPVFFATDGAPEDIRVLDINGDEELDVVVGGFFGAVTVLLGNGDGTFGEKSSYAVLGNPFDINLGDFNGDGFPDIAAGGVENNTSLVTVFINDGEGVFPQPQMIASPHRTELISIMDVDGDDILDLVPLLNTGFGDINVLRGLGDGAFDTQLTVSTGDFGNRSVELVDIEGDGHLDIVSMRHTPSNILVFPGNGDATFMEPIVTAAGSNPVQFVTGRVNGDTELDIVSAHLNPGRIGTMLGDGNGSFQAPSLVETNSSIIQVVTGDFDRDGALDVAFVPTVNSDIGILLGIGDGSFQNLLEVGAPGFPQGIQVADFNGDNNPDLATAESGGGVRVYLGTGSGAFGAPSAAGGGSRSIGVGDVNSDGKQDIVSAGFDDGFVHLALGDGDGTFQPVVSFNVTATIYPSSPLHFNMVDVSLDGSPDILFSEGDGFQSVGILLGDGSGFFSGFSRYGLAGTFTMGIAAGDLDEDGQPDIAAANSGANNISILLHR
ncbi:MAG: VCBS repeat-containing protein [Candidatus Hydrogenedentes bacterium]|nr:VCBS repeat-containing protein [Candidatus Hydrogenedentota bacterium]